MVTTFHPYTNSRKWVIAIVVVVVVAAMATGGYFLFIHKPAKPAPVPFNANQDQITRLQKQGVPTTPDRQLSYYSELAQYYENIHDNDNALKYYLKAQTVADDNDITQVVFYLPIANIYKVQGNAAIAKVYYQKEISYLNDFLKQHPETEEGGKQAIKEVQEDIQSL